MEINENNSGFLCLIHHKNLNNNEEKAVQPTSNRSSTVKTVSEQWKNLNLSKLEEEIIVKKLTNISTAKMKILPQLHATTPPAVDDLSTKNVGIKLYSENHLWTLLHSVLCLPRNFDHQIKSLSLKLEILLCSRLFASFAKNRLNKSPNIASESRMHCHKQKLKTEVGDTAIVHSHNSLIFGTFVYS